MVLPANPAGGIYTSIPKQYFAHHPIKNATMDTVVHTVTISINFFIYG